MLNNINKPAHKRSIRDIPLRSNNNENEKNMPEDSNPVDLRRKTEEVEKVKKPKTKKRKKNNKKKYIIGTTITIFLILIVFVSNIFTSATVTITPKEFSISELNVNLDLTPIDEIIDDNQLGYRIIEFTKTSEIPVSANGEEMVQSKSEGVITVYNEFTTSPQRLIKNTRFETSDGLIYRTPESIEIPGYTEGSDGIVPGELDITIVADEVGQEYNLAEGEVFTIPGFIGQDAYDFFRAESVTRIDGGYDGIRKIVNENDLENAKSDLNNRVRSDLEIEINNQLPNNVIALFSEDSFSYGPVEQSDLSETEVNLTLSGSISVILVDRGAIAASVAQQNPDSGYRQGEDLVITNFDDLEITLIDNPDDIELKINGDISIKWIIDSNKLKDQLSDKHKDQFREIISDYRGVVSVTTKFFPFWINTFPENINKIKIVEKGE